MRKPSSGNSTASAYSAAVSAGGQALRGLHAQVDG